VTEQKNFSCEEKNIFFLFNRNFLTALKNFYFAHLTDSRLRRDRFPHHNGIYIPFHPPIPSAFQGESLRRELRGRVLLRIRRDKAIHKSIFKTIVQASEKFWILPFAHKTRRGFDIIERTGAFFSRIVHTSSWPTESEPSPPLLYI
jgi:hypothetical protein